jgi:hypothetical protein
MSSRLVRQRVTETTLDRKGTIIWMTMWEDKQKIVSVPLSKGAAQWLATELLANAAQID